MWFLILPVLLFAAAVSVSFYRYLRLALDTFGVDTKRKAVRLLICFSVALLELVCLLFSSAGLIFLLHLLAFALLLQAVNWAASKFHTPPHFWRRLYGSGILPLLLAAAVLAGGWLHMHHVVQTDYTVYTQKDIRPEGYRIALIADVHFGVSLDEAQLQAVCDRLSAQNPDAVILCGDIVDNSTTADGMHTVFRILGDIESTFGTFYVFGNHDRPTAHLEGPFSEAALIAAIESSGITILQDRLYPLADDLVLVGREDSGFGQRDGRASIDTLLADADREAFILTLDHQPREYAENAAAGTDLLLSGHTHGGQIWPVNLLDKLFGFNAAVYGHIQIENNTQAIVTSGLGGWGFPIKTAAPAEYVMISIRPQP